ncbi:MAG: ABC transporter permease subunit, partial [Myxococcota bacterium]
MLDAPAISKVVATLGILLVLQALTIIRYGPAPIAYFESMLPRETTTIFGTVIGQDRLWLLGIAAVLTAGLSILFRATTIGLATTASAEKPETVAALGWSPDRIAAGSWALGAGLAAAAGILVIPIFTGVDPNRFTLVLISALAAALVGAFKSFPLVFVGGIGLGIGESLCSRYIDQDIQGASKALPLLVIVAFLVVRGRSLPSRGSMSHHLPRIGTGVLRPMPIFVASIVAGVSLVTWLPSDWVSATMVSLTAAVIMLSIVVLTGYGGQLSLGQFALAGIGALIAGRLVSTTDVPFEAAVLIAVAAAIPIGMLFAIPALRTRGINLAVVTLGLGAPVQSVLFANND